MKDFFGHSGAEFSACGRYRYSLFRSWDTALPWVLFLMMNPSTADATTNDATIERICRRLMKWHAQGVRINGAVFRPGGVWIANVFAWRETDSTQLVKRIAEGIDIVGQFNDEHIMAMAKNAAFVVCAWGKPGNLNGRGDAVAKMLRDAGVPLYMLAANADGSPKHPLYVGYDVEPILMPA